MVMYLKGHGLNYKLLPITLQNVTNYTELQIILSINLSCSFIFPDVYQIWLDYYYFVDPIKGQCYNGGSGDGLS